MRSERVSIIAGLIMSCIIYTTGVAEADNTVYDSLLLSEVQDVESVDNYEPDDVTRLYCFNLSFKVYDSNVEDVVLASFGIPDGEGVCRSSNITYMDYRAVTAVNSKQYRLLNSDACYTDEMTGIRKVGDRYCIAVGTGFQAGVGSNLNVVFANGSVVKCVVGDIKSDAHTDDSHRYQAVDGSVVEMIVDGTVFHSTSQYPQEVRGPISRIEVVK